MEEEIEKKIFDYETNWLKDRIDIRYQLKEALGNKDFGSKNYKSGKNLKNDLASIFVDKKFKVKKTSNSLIDEENVEDLKQKLKIKKNVRCLEVVNIFRVIELS